MPTINLLLDNQTGAEFALESLTNSGNARWSQQVDTGMRLPANDVVPVTLQAPDDQAFVSTLVFQCDQQTGPIPPLAQFSVTIAQQPQNSYRNPNWFAGQTPGSNLVTNVNGGQNQQTGNWQVVLTVRLQNDGPNTEAGL